MKHSTMKIMSLILAVCMVISLLPMSVLASGTGWTWNIYLNCNNSGANGVTVTDGYHTWADDTKNLGDGTADNYNIYWDSANATLHLKDFTLTVTQYYTGILVDDPSGSSGKQDFNIVLEGTNTISGDGSYSGKFGALNEANDTAMMSALNISGNGSLNATASGGFWMFFANLTVSGSANVTINSTGVNSPSYPPLISCNDLAVHDTAVLNLNAAKGAACAIYNGKDIDVAKTAALYVKTASNDEPAMYVKYAFPGVEFLYSTDNGASWTEGGNFDVQRETHTWSYSSTETCYVSSTSGGDLATYIKFSGVITNTVYGANGYTTTPSYAPGALSAFTLQLVPAANYVDAGANVTYNINLTRTKYSELGTEIQTMDFGVGYDSNVTFSAAAPAAGYTGLTIAKAEGSNKITLRQTDTSKGIAIGQTGTITLGTVTFTMPSADYVTANGTNGVYALADFTLEDGTVANNRMVAVNGENNGVTPKLTQYKSKDHGKNVCAMYATLKVAAPVKCTISDVYDTANNNATLIEYSTSATYSNHSKAFNIPVSARPEIQITPKAGYKVKSSVALPLTQTNAFGLTSQALSGPQNYYWTLNSTLLGNSVFDADEYIEEISYTVTPYDGFGSQVSGTTSNYTISSTTYTFPAAITHSGYTFAGWKVTKAAEGGSVFKDTTTVYSAGQQISLNKSYGNVIITAQWTPNEQTNTYGEGVTQKSPEPATKPKTAESVTVTVTPPTGKMITNLSIKDTDNSTIAFTPAVNNQTTATDFTFTQSYTGVTVTPTFGDIGYTVTYDTAGGSAVTAGSYNISDKSYTVTSTVPTRQGYTFANWKVTAAGSQAAAATDKTAYFSMDTAYTSGAAVTLDNAYGNVTLTAQWTGAAHTDNTYNNVTQTSPNDGAEPPTATNPKTGDTVVIRVPDKDGYSIIAPAVTQKDGSTTAVTVTDNGDTDAHTWAFIQPAYGVDVTPNYTANNYTVTLAKNATDATDGTTSLSVTYDSDTVGTIATPTRAGYTFAGWYTAADESGVQVLTSANAFAAPVEGCTSTENSVTVWKVTGATTLYAHWTATAQTNAELPSTVTAADTTDSSKTYPDIPTGDTVTLSITPPAGYYLSGLTITKTDDASTTVKYTGDIDTTNKPTGVQTFTYVQPAYGVTVTPAFSGRTYTLTLSSAADENYTFEGSSTVTVTCGSNVVTGSFGTTTAKAGYYYAISDVRNFQPKAYSATFMRLNAGTYSLLTNITAYLDGKNQVSLTDANGNWVYPGDITVNAPAIAENYILHFNTNGGTGLQDAKVIYGYSGPSATTTMLTTKTGYYVEGWYLDSDFTTRIANNATSDYAMTYAANVSGYTDADGKWIKDLGTSGTAEITFYAKWQPIEGGVFLHMTGNDRFPNGKFEQLEKAYYGDSSVTVNDGDNIHPVKTGYNLSGWTNTTSGTTKYINADGTFVAGTTFADASGKWKKTDGRSYDFYPMWVLKTTVVSFDLNYTGAGTNPDSITETYSQTAVSASVPTTGPDGYSFAGWYTAKTGGTKMFKADGSAVTYHWENEDPTMTLYAQWTGTPQTNTALPSTVTATDTTDSTQTYPSIPTGDTVSLSITPAEGYYLSGLTITKTGEPSTTVTYTGTIDTATKPTGAQTFTYQQPAYGVTVTPTFTGRTYTITLSAAGVTHATGLTGTTTLTVIYGSSASFANMPAIGTDTGYAANDLWYAAPNTTTGAVLWGMGGQDNSAGGFAENSVYTSAGSPVVWKHAGNVTLYPGIESKKTTVTLNTNGGTSNGHPYFDATYDATLSGTQIVPTRTGYTFAGWTATQDGTDLVVNAASDSYVACSGVTSSDTPPVWKVDAETYTLYAKWSANSQTVTLPTDNTVAVSSPTTTGTKVTLTVTPPTGKKIASLTVTNVTDSSSVSYTSTTFNTDGSQQTFTYTQPASGVTVEVNYVNIDYTVSYVVPASVTVSGTSTSYNIDSTSLTIPGAFTRTGFTFDGWTISRPEGSSGTVNGGSNTVAAGTTSIALNKATGNITLTAKWTATSNQMWVDIKDKNLTANSSGALGTATFTNGNGITKETEDSAARYYITGDNAANFTVAVKPGYAITSVTYAVVNDDASTGTATTLAANEDGSYTIPAAACVTKLMVTVNTELSDSAFTVNANIADGTFQHYSLYSDTKSLVRIHINTGIVNPTGLDLNGISVYKTSAYDGYEYAALVDLSNVSDKTEAGLQAYIKTLLKFTSTACSTLNYNKDVNGSGKFMIDDISIEYDYTSMNSLSWTPTDGYLIIGDIANSSNALTSDGVLNSYDVAAFVNSYGK